MVTRAGATATRAAATPRARSDARIAALPVAGSTSPGDPSVEPVTVSVTRGSRAASRAHAISAPGAAGSVAEPGAKSSIPAAATGIGAGSASFVPNPLRIPCARAPCSGRSDAGSLRPRLVAPICWVAWTSTKKPTSNNARSASVISQSGLPAGVSGNSLSVMRRSTASTARGSVGPPPARHSRVAPRARPAPPAALRSARVRRLRRGRAPADGWRPA